MALAERHGFPLVTLVDTPGAYPGVAAEQHGQGGAIARSQAMMARLEVPTVACIIGEGGSGGAVAIALADRVLMQENAIYSVISPEGCAAILWRDAGEAREGRRRVQAGRRPLPRARRDRRDRARARGRRAARVTTRPRGCSARPSPTRSTSSRTFPRRRCEPGGARSSARWGCSPESDGFIHSFHRLFPCTKSRWKHSEYVLRPAKPAPTDPPRGWRRRASTSSPRCAHGSDLRSRRAQTSTAWVGEACGLAEGLRAQARPRARRPSRSRAGRAGRRRSSSSSATTRAGSTTTSGSSATARSRAGRCRRACRSSRASSTSPSTSRTTRSTYATFEGEIPAGNYGAGTVEIWDRGTYELVEEKKDGGLTVRLHGERLDGHLGARAGEALRRPEELAAPPQARGGGRAARERRQGPCEPTRRCSPRSPRRSRAARAGCYEVKWDGYRAIAYVARRRGDADEPQRQRPDRALRRRSRSALERAVRTPDCVLDGEVCALDEQGRASFSAMQQGKPGRSSSTRLRRARGRRRAASSTCR